MTLYKMPFENIVRKGENAGNQHFLLFPTMFSTLPETNFNFSVTYILSPANAFNFNQSILSFGKKLKICRLVPAQTVAISIVVQFNVRQR